MYLLQKKNEDLKAVLGRNEQGTLVFLSWEHFSCCTLYNIFSLGLADVFFEYFSLKTFSLPCKMFYQHVSLPTPEPSAHGMERIENENTVLVFNF